MELSCFPFSEFDFVAAKGFQSLKFSYDPATGQNVGVSL